MPLRQVFPSRIVALDQPELLFSAAALDFFFAGDGIANVVEDFEINEPEDLVLGAKAWGEAFAVFDEPAFQVIGHAGVQVTRAAGEDVDDVVFAHRKGQQRIPHPAESGGFGMTAIDDGEQQIPQPRDRENGRAGRDDGKRQRRKLNSRSLTTVRQKVATGFGMTGKGNGESPTAPHPAAGAGIRDDKRGGNHSATALRLSMPRLWRGMLADGYQCGEWIRSNELRNERSDLVLRSIEVSRGSN